MNWITSPFGERVQQFLSGWIERNSEDPTDPILTDAVALRASLQELMYHYDEIREEVLWALPHATSIQGDLFFDDSITNDGKWDKIYLKWYDDIPEKTRIMFPRLTSVLDKHSDVHLAMVSILRPGARIEPHMGPWRGSIRVHVGIKTPNNPRCWLSVGGRSFYWQDRKVEAFDDTYLHMVRNDTDQERIILFLDVERKMKSRWAQFVVSTINSTIARSTGRRV